MNQTILIDGDVLVYRTAFSVETPIYVCGGGIYIRKGYAEKIAKERGLTVKKRVNVGSEGELRQKLDASLKQMFDDIGSHSYKLYLTAEKVNNNFRSKIATFMPYKGNRTEFIRPVHYKRLREILVKEYGAILVEGQEADDALAIEQARLFNEYKHYDMSIIATIDKDLRTVPGNHYHFVHRTIEMIDEERALKNFYKQILLGDAVDNIPGLTKLLKIKGREEESKKLSYGHYLKKYEESTIDLTAQQCYDKVKEMYRLQGFGQEEINEIGNLLWLRRYEGQIWSDGNAES